MGSVGLSNFYFVVTSFESGMVNVVIDRFNNSLLMFLPSLIEFFYKLFLIRDKISFDCFVIYFGT